MCCSGCIVGWSAVLASARVVCLGGGMFVIYCDRKLSTGGWIRAVDLRENRYKKGCFGSSWQLD